MFSLPSREDDAAVAAFKTHLNYLEAFNHLLNQDSSDSSGTMLDRIYDRINRSGVCNAVKRNDIDVAALKRSLSHAWGIERLLYANQEATSDDSLLRLANNWSCIQAYYVLYHATQTLQIAKGQKRPESHTATQKTFVNLWSTRGINLAPWSFVYSPDHPMVIPAGVVIDENIHNFTHCDEMSSWSLCFKALRTTRNESLPEAFKNKRIEKQKCQKLNWQKEETARLSAGKRPRLPRKFPLPHLTGEEKRAVDGKIRPYSLMDYLYRLRIKVNYQDADMFVDGPASNDQSIKAYTFLCNLASATLFLSELSIIPIWGKTKFSEYYKEWHKSKTSTLSSPGLGNRGLLLDAHCAR